MTTERVNIIVSEKGSRIVKRNLQSIGDAANKSAGSLKLLTKALGGFAAIRILTQIAGSVIELSNSYVNLQNRLRAVGYEGKSLTSVYKDLVRVSNETRSSAQASIELFARLSVSAKELGASEKELVNFTKSVNQALILSGTKSYEASAGLIQFSQGLAAGALRGDELRSVIEQLPKVADIIAKEFQTTRYGLKKFGEEGKLTADRILKAFRDAGPELEKAFAKTIPTIGQAAQVFQNSLFNAVGQVDDFYGASETLARSLMSLSEYTLDAAFALTRLGQVLAVAGAAYGAFWASQKVGILTNMVTQWVAYHKAIKAGDVVVLGSAMAEKQKAEALLASALAANQNAAANASKLVVEKAMAASTLKNTKYTLAEITAQKAYATQMLSNVKNKGLRVALTRTIVDLRRAEVAVTRQAAIQEEALAAATASSAAAQKVAAGTTAKLNKARAANVAATKAAAGTTTLWGQALGGLKGVINSVWMVISRHPIGALITAIAAAAAAITIWRNEIKLTSRGMATLGDLIQVLWNKIKPTLDLIGRTLSDILGPTWDKFTKAISSIEISLGGMLLATARALDTWKGLWVGTFNAILVSFKLLPDAVGEIFVNMVNAQISLMTGFMKKVIEMTNDLRKTFHLSPLQIPKFLDYTIPNQFKGSLENYGKELLKTIGKGISDSTALEDAVRKLLKETEDYAVKERMLKGGFEGSFDIFGAPPDLAGSGGGSGLAEEMKKLDGLISRYDKLYDAQVKLKKLREALTIAVQKGIRDANGVIFTQERMNKIMQQATFQLRDQLDPIGAMSRKYLEHTMLLTLSNKEREVEVSLLEMKQNRMKMGLPMSAKEIANARERIKLQQEENRLAEVRESIRDSIKKPGQQFSDELKGLKDLMGGPGGISAEEANKYLVDNNQELFENTKNQQRAWVESYKQTLGKIQELRNKDVIDEQTANQMRLKAKVALNQKQLASTSEFYGKLATLTQSSNRELAAIGKAAAVAQATIAGILAVQKTWAQYGNTPLGVPAAVTMGIIQAANVAAIAEQGFAKGGYTGNLPTGSVAGVVHGQEFVVNADATSRNRAVLEAMNSGRQLSTGSPQINVKVENYGTSKEFDVQMTENEVRIIARDVARDVVRRDTADIVSSEIRNPNSRVSKSLSNHTQTARRR